MRAFYASLAVVVTVTALLVGASPASATYRGENGRIAFRRYLNADQTWAAILTVRPNGSGLRRVTFPRRGFVHDGPDWSPDGRWIAYTRVWRDSSLEGPHVDGHPNALVRIRRSGHDRENLSTGICPPDSCDGDILPNWAPNGKEIAFTRLYPTDRFEKLAGISLMQIDGTHYRQVTPPRLGHRDIGPAWAPNGEHLAFVRNIDSDCGCPHADDHAIFVVRRNGSHLRRITPWRLQGSLNPDWSPDGHWIVFTSVTTVPPASRDVNVWMIHPNGEGLRRVTSNPDDLYKFGRASFSPDRHKLTTSRGVGDGERDVYVMNRDGSDLHDILDAPWSDSFADWGPRPR
jgi:Tol biopolymer transport system component